jgi:alanyl-tRNA synthetase
MAWDLLVNVYKLPRDRIYATYFQGDETMGLPVVLSARTNKHLLQTQHQLTYIWQRAVHS